MPPDGFVETVLRFRTDVVAHQPGYVEAALGVTHEEVTFEGEKGHALVALVGWDSEQSWQTFANSEEYKEKNPGQTLEEGVLRGFEMEIVELQAYS
jgi:heme-degrading monooxygenase HmoA